ncbi:hypothetical protein [Ancylobacter sp. 3268]|uniref:hypothetical protein n=1 Tax=Ancylobacter sp. 3268 TaxID=2817752 RepID=UPI00286A6A15|nr:hypothetical protein [Ancylobacter sp. 3268]
MGFGRVIVVISIGNRPWFASCLSWMERYAKRCKADLRIIESTPSRVEFPFPDLPDKPGRPHKFEYAMKQYCVGKLMDEGYSNVLMLDDTCIISPTAPDLFSIVEPGRCGYTHTSRDHAEDSFRVIQAETARNGWEEVAYDPALYANTGVMLYDAVYSPAFLAKNIIEAAPLLFARYPHQTLSYYLLRKYDVSMQRIDKRFNNSTLFVNEPGTDWRDSELTDSFIYHVTGFWKEDREEVVNVVLNKLAEKFVSELGEVPSV